MGFSVPRLASAPPLLLGEEGLRAAYVAHAGELYRLAMRGLADPGAAQDVVQETFLRAWRARDRYDATRASLRTWLFEIARNVVTDTHRARTSRPWLQGLADHQTLEQVAPGSTAGWDDLIRTLALGEALSRLGEHHRLALEQTYLADRGYPEVAAELGISESTLRSRVFYGLKALRVVMDEMGMTP